MPTKVLVFESDAAFAGELRSELDALGCTTTIVDDGNAGLQQAIADRPDLILLAIELPRMNGFSVCNKLKKDPSLKEVPLIIMSTESSDETFDQHRKLRTRAEDYIHKPIAFRTLLEHIQNFVPIGMSGHETAIVIEDEIEVGSADYLLEEDGMLTADTTSPESARPASLNSVPPTSARSPGSVEAEVDAFAESAFGRLTGVEAPQPIESRPPANGAANADLVGTTPPRTSMPPAARGSIRPPAFGIDAAEHDRLRAELTAARTRIDDADQELSDSRREVEKLRIEASDSARLAREVDELRSKLAAAAKTGGISSRDFLDLREALNKKDKEILAFREQLSRKDREIVEAQDHALAFERGRADLEERLLALERELGDTRERNEALASERDLAKKANEEFRARLDRAKADSEARERQVSELRARQADDRAASEVRLASVRAELDQGLANERAEHARALDQAELRRRADLEQLRRERDAALTDARDEAERERREALALQLSELRQDHESKLASVQRLNQQETDRVRNEAAQHEEASLDALGARHAAELRALTEDRDARAALIELNAEREIAQANERTRKVEIELASVREELHRLDERTRLDDGTREAQLVELTQRLSDAESSRDAVEQRLAETSTRAALLEDDIEATRSALEEAKSSLDAEASRVQRARAKWEADRQSLERAKDALAVALAQIEDAETRPPP